VFEGVVVVVAGKVRPYPLTCGDGAVSHDGVDGRSSLFLPSHNNNNKAKEVTRIA